MRTLTRTAFLAFAALASFVPGGGTTVARAAAPGTEPLTHLARAPDGEGVRLAMPR